MRRPPPGRGGGRRVQRTAADPGAGRHRGIAPARAGGKWGGAGAGAGAGALGHSPRTPARAAATGGAALCPSRSAPTLP